MRNEGLALVKSRPDEFVGDVRQALRLHARSLGESAIEVPENVAHGVFVTPNV